MATRTWTLKIAGDSTGAVRAVDKIEDRWRRLDINKGLSGKLSRLGDSFGRLSSRAAESGRKIARGLAIGVGGGIAALTVLGSKAVTAASDLNESANAISVVFGPATAAIRNFGKRSAQAVGLSTRAFQEMATPVGAALRNAGFGADQAAESTIRLTKRAADMASVFNTDVSESMTAIQAALRGEADPIERFGVNMSAAAVQAEALSLGINASWNEMTQQEKMTARLSLFFKQSNRVAGDFANTSGEVANQERIASAEAENWAAVIGQKLIPVKARLIAGFGALMRTLDQLGSAFMEAFRGEGVTSGGLVGFAERLGVAVRAAWPQVQRIAGAIGDFALRIRDFFKGNPKVLFAVLGTVIGGVLLGAVVALGAALISVISPFVLVVAVLAAVVGAVVYAYTRWDVFRDVVDAVVRWFTGTAVPAVQAFVDLLIARFQDFAGWVQRIWPQVQEAITHVLNVVRGVISVFITVVTGLWDRFGSTILDFVQRAWNAIWQVIQGVLTIIRGIITTVLAVINGDWGRAWDGILMILRGVWQVIQGVIGLAIAQVQLILGLAWESIKFVVGVAWAGIKAVIFGVWEGIKTVVGGAIDWVSGKIEGALNIIALTWALIWGGMKDVLGGIWDGITSAVRTGANAVIRVVNWFIRLLNHIPGVDIDEIGLIGGGGSSGGLGPNNPQRRATGGFVTNGPQFLVGEGNPAHPEAVIATDPRFRRRNLGLLSWAAGRMGVPGFAMGGILDGLGDVVGAVTRPLGGALDAVGGWLRDLSARALRPVRDAAKSAVDQLPGPLSWLRDMSKGVIDQMYEWASGKTVEAPSGPGRNAGFGGGGVERWRAIALQALNAAGAPASWIGSLLRRMNQESGGNPNAINNWDINARRGDPSRGLMQTIGSTFNRWAGRYRSRGIYDPFANIYAAIRYTVSRYGSGPAGWDRSGGYLRGGIVGASGGFVHPREMVLTQSDQHQLLRLVRSAREDGGVHVHGDIVVPMPPGATEEDGRRFGRGIRKGLYRDELERRRVLTDARIT